MNRVLEIYNQEVPTSSTYESTTYNLYTLYIHLISWSHFLFVYCLLSVDKLHYNIFITFLHHNIFTFSAGKLSKCYNESSVLLLMIKLSQSVHKSSCYKIIYGCTWVIISKAPYNWLHTAVDLWCEYFTQEIKTEKMMVHLFTCLLALCFLVYF